MQFVLDANATQDERDEAGRLAAEDVMANGQAIADLLVSCYEARGEGGAWEEVHELRSDRSCRCGRNKARPRS